MPNQIESPKKVPTKETSRHTANWMQLEIAPLIAERINNGKPLPGESR